jgi:hypothetical protein
MAIGVRERQRRAEPALASCPLGDRSAQPKPRQRTLPRYLDLAQWKWHVGFGECLDHCFLGREPGRKSVQSVEALAVVDLAGREDLAQVSVAERRQRVMNFLDRKDIASGADAVSVDVVRQSDHAVAEIIALSREFTAAPSLAGRAAADVTSGSCLDQPFDYLRDVVDGLEGGLLEHFFGEFDVEFILERKHHIDRRVRCEAELVEVGVIVHFLWIDRHPAMCS